MNENYLKILEEKIGYSFCNKELLEEALTHKTYAFEANDPLDYNERLEFLGDSVLNFIVAEQLYISNIYFSEGELTRRRAIGVNNNFLADVSKKLGIGKFLMLGKGEIKQNGANNRTNLANSLEAIIGAIYLDSDIDMVREFILSKIFNKKFKF
jgi:ribonuclease-3